MLKLAHLPILVTLRGRGGPKPMQLVLSLSLVKEALALPGEDCRPSVQAAQVLSSKEE